jgi:hypothetical protein
MDKWCSHVQLNKLFVITEIRADGSKKCVSAYILKAKWFEILGVASLGALCRPAYVDAPKPIPW